MHANLVSRRALLSPLLALVFIAGVLFVTAPKASAAKSDCPGNSVCVWSGGNFTGTRSQWAASETGCHNHAGNEKLRSGFNNTNSMNVRFGGLLGGASWGPGTSWTLEPGSNAVTGEICWPV